MENLEQKSNLKTFIREIDFFLIPNSFFREARRMGIETSFDKSSVFYGFLSVYETTRLYAYASLAQALRSAYFS